MFFLFDKRVFLGYVEGMTTNLNRKAHDLTQTELEGHHPLCDLASEAGYPSLTSFLNDHRLWDETLDDLEDNLKNQINSLDK